MTNNDLETVYQLYYRDVYFYTLSLCKNPNVAESIVSDAFYRALVSLKQTDGIKPWLFTVSRNLWYDTLRKRKRFSEQPIEECLLSCEDHALETLVKNEQKRAVLRAVDSLPKPYRECVILYYFCGLSHSEIAQSMHITPGAARTILYRARIKLKPILKEVVT